MPKITADTIQAHRERTYDALLDAMVDLALERGFASVTLRDVAERAGISRTAIYNYATGREDLLIAAIARRTSGTRAEIARIAQDDPGTAPDRLQAIVRALLLAFAAGARELALLRSIQPDLRDPAQQQAVGSLREEMLAHLTRVIQDGIDAGDYDVPDRELFIGEIDAVVAYAIERALSEPARAEDIADATVAFMQRALGRADAATGGASGRPAPRPHP